jgi:hypothetical protein
VVGRMCRFHAGDHTVGACFKDHNAMRWLLAGGVTRVASGSGWSTWTVGGAVRSADGRGSDASSRLGYFRRSAWRLTVAFSSHGPGRPQPGHCRNSSGCS